MATRIKMCYIHSTAYDSATEDKVLTHATTWMNPETIRLSKRTQSLKTTYYRIPFTQNVQSRQIFRDRKQTSGCQGLGG